MFPLSLRALARGARRRTSIAPLLIAAPVALAAFPAAAQAGSVTFDAVGCGGTATPSAPGNQWVVPAGVDTVRVTLYGQPGGNGGGQSAHMYGTTDVTAGEVLYACVNVGGGRGGTAPFGATAGGDGGGYSSISKRADGDLALAIAGGGGGTGGIYRVATGGRGGDAGTIAPNAGGGDGVTPADWPDSSGGRGATASGGGAGGVNSAAPGFDGRAGDRGTGGHGGNGNYGGPGGGGGGGGVWGGGGGAGGQGWDTKSAGGGGGGGTSSCNLVDCRLDSAGVAARVIVEFADPPTPTTTTVSVAPARALWNRTGTLRAVVSPAPAGGTVAFKVDGSSAYGCGAVAVDATSGVAECDTTFPGARGSHTVTAVYSGYDGLPTRFVGSEDEDQFTVYAGIPSVSPSPTVAFGEVELGKSTTRPLTITNVGDADLTFDGDESVYVAEYVLRARPPRSREFTVADDQCAGRVVAPNASCTVTVTFTPSAIGERSADFEVFSDSYEGAEPVVLVGTGIEQRPEPKPEPQPVTPTTPTMPVTPTTPGTPSTPAPTPAKPAQTPRTPAAGPAVGASSPLSVARGAQVTQAGGVRLPIVCPPGQACRVSGTLTLEISGGQARASAKTTRVLVRFSGVKIAAGATKTLFLKLPAAFVKAQQKKGVRKLPTTLTVNTVLGNGQRVTRRQAVTLLIPRARAAQRRAAPRQAEQRPSFTG